MSKKKLTKKEVREEAQHRADMRETVAILNLMSLDSTRTMIQVPDVAFEFDTRMRADIGKAANMLMIFGQITENEAAFDLTALLHQLRLMLKRAQEAQEEIKLTKLAEAAKAPPSAKAVSPKKNGTKNAGR